MSRTELQNLFKGFENFSYRELQSKLRTAKMKGLSNIRLNQSKDVLIFEIKRLLNSQANQEGFEQIPLSKILHLVDIQNRMDEFEHGEDRYLEDATFEEDGFKFEVDFETNRVTKIFSPEVELEIANFERIYRQFDNSPRKHRAFDYGFYSDIRDLHNWGLIEWDLPFVEPADGFTLLDWQNQFDYRVDAEDMFREALSQKRLDILRLYSLGIRSPRSRREFWQKEYTNQLGTDKAKPWEWQANPESKEVCPELSDFYQCPPPEDDAKTVLNHIHHNQNPFKPNEVKHQNGFQTFVMGGVFANNNYYNDYKRSQLLRAFRTWHRQALEEIGRDRLAAVYEVVFGSNWGVIQEILGAFSSELWFDVLEVSPNATKAEIKKSYWELMRKWHPDVNQSEEAKLQTQRINKAYEEAKQKAIA